MGVSLAAVGEGWSPAAECGILSAGLPVADGRLQGHGLQAFPRWAPWSWLLGSRAQAHRLWWWAYLPQGMWGLPGSGIEPTSPALAGGYPPAEPPGKPLTVCTGDGEWSGVQIHNYGTPASTVFAIQCLLYLFIYSFPSSFFWTFSQKSFWNWV